MTVEEIYGQIIQHIVKGLMVHSQMADYYDFLGLKGYKRCHEYHYFKENCVFRSVNRYYINHHNKLIPTLPVDDPEIIPQSWYKYNRDDVDMTTKKNAVKNGVQLWVEWETETKDFYEEMYVQLMNIGEIASGNKVMELIEDVDCELKKAHRTYLNLKAIDFDMNTIVESQKPLHRKYKEMSEKIGMYIC